MRSLPLSSFWAIKVTPTQHLSHGEKNLHVLPILLNDSNWWMTKIPIKTGNGENPKSNWATKNPALLSMKYWIVNRDPYSGLFIIPIKLGSIIPYITQPRFFSLLNCFVVVVGISQATDLGFRDVESHESLVETPLGWCHTDARADFFSWIYSYRNYFYWKKIDDYFRRHPNSSSHTS